MSEVFYIALGQFVRFGLIFAFGYGLYRLLRFLIARIPDDFFGKKKEETWDGVEFLYSVPSNIFGFLVLDYLVISVVTTLIYEGIGDVFRFGLFTTVWGVFTHGMDSLLGIIGCAGIFAATVFGIYQDYPPTRLKILGLIAFFAALVGLGFRFH